MKNKDIFKLYNGLNMVGTLKGVKFSYAIVKNLDSINPTIESIKETLKKSNPEYYKFIEETKGKKEEEVKNLEDKYSKAIKDFDKAEIEILGAETKVDLHEIKQEDIPEEITAQQMNMIFDIVEEK